MQRVVVFLVALAAILLLSGLFGQNTRAQADPSRAEAIQLDVSAVRVENGATADHVYINRNDDGTIESIHGGSWGSGQSMPVDMALDFVKKHHVALGLTAPNVELLRVDREHKANGMTILTLRQYVQGAPVLNGYLDVFFGSSGQMVGLNNRLATMTEAPVGVRGGVEAAASKAASSWKMTLSTLTDYRGLKILESNQTPPRATLKSAEPALWSTTRGLRPVHQVVLRYDEVGAVVRYTVDDHTGDVVETRPLTQAIEGTGDIFNPNPLNLSPLLPEGSLTGFSPESDFQSRMVTVALHDISTDSAGTFFLRGPFTSIVEPGQGGYPPPTPNSADGFKFTRMDSGFAAVNAYYWIDSSARRARALGFPVMGYSAPTRVHDPEAKKYFAFYQPDGDGKGSYSFSLYKKLGLPVAEDGDVIIHETGHGIQDNQTNGRYSADGEAGAQGEGFSDFWACASTYSLSRASGYDPAIVGEWVGLNFPGSSRRVDSDKQYPGNIVGEVHADGEIWSSALWSVFLLLPDSQKDDFLKIVLQSHYVVPDAPSFRDGGHALVDANTALIPNVVDVRQFIRTSLKARGIFTNDAPGSFSVGVTDKGNVISWKNQSDVAGSIQIMRGKANDPPTPYQTFNPSETTYTDAAVDPKGSYTYYMKAIDIDVPSNTANTEAITVVASENVPSQLPAWNQPKTELAQQHASGGGGGGCFIATAAYGTATEPHVMTLRAFRDNVLLPTAPGRWFVATYYRYSPPVADWIREREWARSAVRLGLAPMILTIEHPVLVMVLMALALFAVVRFVRRRRMATALA